MNGSLLQSISKWIKIVLASLFIGVMTWLLIFPPASSIQSPPGRTVVTYWEKWTGNEAEQMKQIVDDFNNTIGARKNIWVQYLSVSSVDRKTLVATAAGVPPDVAGVWDGQVSQFAALDALEPLDEMATAHGITAEYYKPVYWKGCQHDGKLYALISTPAATALHYNRRIFQENAEVLRKAGCDPDRPPRTIEEMDRYALALDLKDEHGRIARAGYLPMEPGWFIVHTAYWFGASLFDEKAHRFDLTNPKVIKAFEWVRSYSARLGPKSMSEFQSGQGGFDSPLNPFMAGTVAMEQQGPWMANFIEFRKPSMSRWNMPQELQERLKRGEKVPMSQRRQYYEWAAAPFPPAEPSLEGATVCGFDVLVIPTGSKHKREAFEFIAFVNRQDVMEKLCGLHCKNSPLAKVSREFIENHQNPYIDVFEDMARSPNAHVIPDCPIWPEAADEVSNTIQKIYLLRQDTVPALREAQDRLQQRYERFMALQKARQKTANAEGTR